MRCLLPAVLCLLAAPLAAQESLMLPSGQEVALQEFLWDEDAQTGRFRFIAPWIGAADADVTEVPADMMALCRDFSLPVMRALYPDSEWVVISFASEPEEFGVMNADVVQFFEGYAVNGQDCIWSEH